ASRSRGAPTPRSRRSRDGRGTRPDIGAVSRLGHAPAYNTAPASFAVSRFLAIDRPRRSRRAWPAPPVLAQSVQPDELPRERPWRWPAALARLCRAYARRARLCLGRRPDRTPLHAAHSRLRVQPAEHLFLLPAGRFARRPALRGPQHLRTDAQLSAARRRASAGDPAAVRQGILRFAIPWHGPDLRFPRRASLRQGVS